MSIYTDSIKVTDAFLMNVKNIEKVNGKFNLESSYKKMILLNARDLVINNSVDLLLKIIIEDSKSYDIKEIETSYNISDYLKRFSDYKINHDKVLAKEGELIKFGKFYYHPMLQKSSSPPKFILDEGMNIIEAPREKFYLENIESFTIDDLVTYFIKETNRVDILPTNFKDNFLKLVDFYGLDLTIYLIDYAVKYALDENLPMPKSPQYLVDSSNISGALTIYHNRKNACFEEGLINEIGKSEP